MFLSDLLRGDVAGDQAGEFICIERRRAGRIVELDAHGVDFLRTGSFHKARREPLSKALARARV
jgi:hypothetical protein